MFSNYFENFKLLMNYMKKEQNIKTPKNRDILLFFHVIHKKLKVFKENTKHYYNETKSTLAKRIEDQHWKEWEYQTHKLALVKFKTR